MIDIEGLKKWLINNSSGIYRPAATAASVIEQLQARVSDLETEIKRTDELLRPLGGHTRWQEFPPSSAPELFMDSDGHYVRCAVNRVVEDGYFRSQANGYDCSHMVNPVLKKGMI